MTDLLVVKAILLDVLTEQQEKRHLRNQYVGGELAWITMERQAMHKEVNRLRACRGRAPIDLRELIRAENGAVGHSDYTEKFALYCAELVLKENPPG